MAYKCGSESYSDVATANTIAAVVLILIAAVLLCQLCKGCRSWQGMTLNWRAAITFPVLAACFVCVLLAPPTHLAWLYWPALVLVCVSAVNILVTFGIYVADIVSDLRSKGRVSRDSTRATGPLYRWYNHWWGAEITPHSERRQWTICGSVLGRDDGGDGDTSPGRPTEQFP